LLVSEERKFQNLRELLNSILFSRWGGCLLGVC